MRVNRLQIENYKGFKGLHEVDLSKGSATVIIGVNGTGKTSLLEVIGLGLQQMTAIFSPASDVALKFTNQNITINEIESNLCCDFESSSGLSGTLRTKQSLSNGLFLDDQDGADIINSLGENFLNIKGGEIPIFIFYQTNRTFAGKGMQNYTVSANSNINRKDAYSDVFNPAINYNQLLNWYLQQVNIQNSEKVKRKNLDYQLPTINAITNAVNNFLSHLEGSSLKNATIDVSHYNNNQVLVISKGDHQLEFNQLSAGEKMVIGVVLDIAYRMAVANPNTENPLLTPGIVLIDELELHLHPKWQMSILNALVKTFVNVQFIVTTHSPLIINHLSNDSLIVLDNFKIISGERIHNTYGKDVNSIVSDFMGASERPLEVKSFMNNIEALLDQSPPNIKMAKDKLKELKQILDPNDYDILRLETIINVEEDEIDYKKS